MKSITTMHSLCKLFGLIMILGLMTSITEPAIAAGKSVKVCNASGQKIWLAIGWHDYTVPAASGWYTLADGYCKRLNFPEADTLLPLYGYAIGNNGAEYRPGSRTESFCIHRTEAFNYNALACGAADALAQELFQTKKSFATWEKLGVMRTRNFSDFEWTVR